LGAAATRRSRKLDVGRELYWNHHFQVHPPRPSFPTFLYYCSSIIGKRSPAALCNVGR
jgi:hypothetical protein